MSVMENCSTPVPLPKLNILQDSELYDKKSSLKKQILSGSKSCPRVPSKNSSVKSRLSFLTQPEKPYQSSPSKKSPPAKIKTHAPQFSPITKRLGGIDDLIIQDKIRPRTISFCKRRAPATTLDSSIDSTESGYDLENSFEDEHQQCLVNKFELTDKLGSGSFGDVYKVRDVRTNQLYALKKSRERFRGKMDRQRKLQEVRKLEQTGRHRNCVKFVQAWEENNFLFIQTELCSMTLGSLTRSMENELLPESEAWTVLVDMLHALNHLSRHKLVHLDIKPDNVFVSLHTDPVVYKLGDFGLMINYESDRVEAQEGDSRFLAFEVLSEVYSPAADMFSLGATLLDCVSSIEMPKSGRWWQLIREGLHNLPQQFASEMSEELFALLCVMMCKEHTNRPSAEQLICHHLLHHKVNARLQQLNHIDDSEFEFSPMKKIKLEQLEIFSSPSKVSILLPPETEEDCNCSRPQVTRRLDPDLTQSDPMSVFVGADISSSSEVPEHETNALLSFTCLTHSTKKTPQQMTMTTTTRSVCEESVSSTAAVSKEDLTSNAAPEQEEAAMVTAMMANDDSSCPRSPVMTSVMDPPSPSSPTAAATAHTSLVTPKSSPRRLSFSSGSSEGFYTPSNPQSDGHHSVDIFYTVKPSRLNSLSGGESEDNQWESSEDDYVSEMHTVSDQEDTTTSTLSSNAFTTSISCSDSRKRTSLSLSRDDQSANEVSPPPTCEQESCSSADMVTPPFVLGSKKRCGGKNVSGDFYSQSSSETESQERLLCSDPKSFNNVFDDDLF